MKLNILIEDKDSGERYLAENKCSPFKFVVSHSVACSTLSDSGGEQKIGASEERRKKKRVGIGGRSSLSLSLSPAPAPPSPIPTCVFFLRSLQFFAFPHYLRAWNRLVSQEKVHRICICQKGNLKPEYKL